MLKLISDIDMHLFIEKGMRDGISYIAKRHSKANNKYMESRPNFISQEIFSQNFVASHKIKPILTLNKPIYVGFSILELSKSLMYGFHYNYIQYKFGAKLLFTDTNSLVYEIKTEDVYEDFYLDKGLFDFSDYSVKV